MKRNCHTKIPGIILLIIGTAFICIGVQRGEPLQVMQKAVKICLECIGIA